MKRISKSVLVTFVLVCIVVGGGAWVFLRDGGPSVTFRTVPVTRSDLVSTISATGTVEPEEVVDVGAQVAGKIVSFGKDKAGHTIDYGSNVEEGMILAQIDDSLYAADVAQAKSQLEQAKAGLLRSQADLGQLEAKQFQADRDWARAKKLGPSEALAQSDFDAAKSAFEVAKANVEVGKSAIEQAKGSVAQAMATLQRAQQNLDYCTIRSPVKGVIIDRRVNIGQTVVSSLNAPSLFLIARDLRRLQVWVSVNEADIGHLHPGQAVTFTVDAFPGRTFQGQVGKIRLNATMTQNVVTYTVEVITDNSDGELLPYLTANARFVINERHNVMVVPNGALRYTPRPGLAEPVKESRGQQDSGDSSQAVTEASQKGGEGGVGKGTLWALQAGGPRAIPVTVGMTDGSMSEVEGEGVKEGLPVIIGEETKTAASGQGGGSPFTPQFFRSGNSRGSGRGSGH